MKTIIVTSLVLMLGGCKPRVPKPEPPAVILVTESHSAILQSIVAEGVRIERCKPLSVIPTTTREAIVAMLNDSVANICVDRPLNAEELAVVAQANLKLVDNKLADDALTVLVNELNPLHELSMESLKKILHGTDRNWSNVSESRWSGEMDVVLTGRNSGAYELLHKKFFPSTSDLALTQALRTQSEVAEYVAHHPRAMGIVSLPVAAHLPTGVRVVALESTTKEEGSRFVKPSQRGLYLGLYPLRYSLYLYTTERKIGVGSTFITFALRLEGQKIIQSSGLVPAKVPSRPIQITSESL